MGLKTIGDLFIYLGAIAAALLSIGTLLHFIVVRPMMRKLRAELAPIHAKTETVVSEVTPDHGRSMKDQIGRTENKLDTLEARFSDHVYNHPK
jgi:hypothetical protein